MTPQLLELQRALSPDVLIELTDDNGDGVADAEVLAEALSAAEAEVRHAVAGTTRLDGVSLPPLLRDIVRTLAIERLYERRREMLPGPWRERADRARLLLEEVRAGRRFANDLRPRRPAVAATRSSDERDATRERLTHL